MMKRSMDGNRPDDAAGEPVVGEGGRSPSTLTSGQDAPSIGGGAPLGPLAPGQRWSAARKREAVPRLMRGESAELLSRERGLPVFKLEQWRQKAEMALGGAPKEGAPKEGAPKEGAPKEGAPKEGAPKEREADPADGQLAAAMRRIGELSMENELLRARTARSGPLGRRRSR